MRARIMEASNVLRSLNDNLSQSHVRAASSAITGRLSIGSGSSGDAHERVTSASDVMLLLMNNDKNIMSQSTMLPLKFVENLDWIDVCIIERRLEQAVEAYSDSTQMCVVTESGPILSSMEAELRERAMRLAGIIVAAVQERGGAAMPLLRGIQALIALGFSSRARSAFLSTKTMWIEASVRRVTLRESIFNYVTDIMHAMFSIVAISFDEFKRHFTSVEDNACILVWVDAQLQQLFNVFAKTVLPSGNLQLIARCSSTALRYCELLEAKGIMCSHSFTSLLLPYLQKELQGSFSALDASVRSSISNDHWVLVPRLAADVLPVSTADLSADHPPSSPAKPAAAALAPPRDSVLHACDCMWTLLRLLNTLLSDAEAVKSYGIQDCIMKCVRQSLVSFSDRLGAMSQPSAAERSRSLPLLLTHLLFNEHVLPFMRHALVTKFGGDEMYISDVPQLVSGNLVVCEAAFVST